MNGTLVYLAAIGDTRKTGLLSDLCLCLVGWHVPYSLQMVLAVNWNGSKLLIGGLRKFQFKKVLGKLYGFEKF